MRIAVRGVGISHDDPVRAYAEYRMFAAVGRFGGRASRVNVRLEKLNKENRYKCAAVLELSPAARVRVHATASRLYGAIDRAAERLAQRAEDRLSATSGGIER
jgi:ribosome-associated translation inhibitor RaiA